MTSGNFYGDTATGIHRAVDLWEHRNPGKPLPRHLYRALIRHGKPKAAPGIRGLERLGQLHTWYDRALSQSWQVGGVGQGLSNGAYRAGHVLDGIPPVDNKTVTNARLGRASGPRIEATPGTLKFRVRGQITPQAPQPRRQAGRDSKTDPPGP
ncbi:MAG: hypothetical protein KatS3mg075_406 [Meiothermus sp.]|nr:MAG: hypothetical protein KatS3mg075_406 [Meiothermus sp.]